MNIKNVNTQNLSFGQQVQIKTILSNIFWHISDESID